MMWGAMTAKGLSALHVAKSMGSKIDGEYYRKEILEKTLLPALSRQRTTGSVDAVRLVRRRADAVFVQDGARPHTADLTQAWGRGGAGKNTRTLLRKKNGHLAAPTSIPSRTCLPYWRTGLPWSSSSYFCKLYVAVYTSNGNPSHQPLRGV